MKRKFLLLTLIAGLGVGTTTFAQQRPPAPQPRPQQIEHRDNRQQEVRYYYLPQYNAYFDALNKVYFYKKNNKWHKTSKPARIAKNIGQARREPLRDLKKNEMPYSQNAQHQQRWKR